MKSVWRVLPYGLAIPLVSIYSGLCVLAEILVHSCSLLLHSLEQGQETDAREVNGE